MWKIILIIFLMIGCDCFAQTHIEYISEKSDSMALINKQDVDVINKVFEERNVLDSLHNINEQIISNLEQSNRMQAIVLEDQSLVIKNKDLFIAELDKKNKTDAQKYSEKLKKEKRKTNSFQATTGLSVLIIILILIL